MKTYSIKSASTGLFAATTKQLGLSDSWSGEENAARLTLEEATKIVCNLNSLVPNGAILVKTSDLQRNATPQRTEALGQDVARRAE